jgi:DNA polymerase-4
MERTILHVDVNSAYLSWEAVYRLQHGSQVDLRTIPSVVGGDEKSRHGIVLARSIPAKKFDIKTGEVLWSARSKCPNLVVLSPSYPLYMNCSNAMVALLKEYSPVVERYSVDECFVDLTDHCHGRSGIDIAWEIKEQFRNRLGYTVNVGVSVNKLLAKMASELEKPDRLHTLYPHEIPKKLWPLPVRELFLSGPRTIPKLYKLNIFTIGQLAHAPVQLLQEHFKSHGPAIWKYANGIDDSPVVSGERTMKGVGNSTTAPYDVDNEKEALLYLLSLTETVAMRLRGGNMTARVVTVSFRSANLAFYSHQRRLAAPTNNTEVLFKEAKKLFLEGWKREPLRHVGVHLSELAGSEFCQMSLFDELPSPGQDTLDKSIDLIRSAHGPQALVRGTFLHSGIPPLCGGVHEAFPNMRSLL